MSTTDLQTKKKKLRACLKCRLGHRHCTYEKHDADGIPIRPCIRCKRLGSICCDTQEEHDYWHARVQDLLYGTNPTTCSIADGNGNFMKRHRPNLSNQQEPKPFTIKGRSYHVYPPDLVDIPDQSSIATEYQDNLPRPWLKSPPKKIPPYSPCQFGKFSKQFLSQNYRLIRYFQNINQFEKDENCQEHIAMHPQQAINLLYDNKKPGVILNPHQKIVGSNQMARDFLGIEGERLHGMVWTEVEELDSVQEEVLEELVASILLNAPYHCYKYCASIGTGFGKVFVNVTWHNEKYYSLVEFEKADKFHDGFEAEGIKLDPSFSCTRQQYAKMKASTTYIKEFTRYRLPFIMMFYMKLDIEAENRRKVDLEILKKLKAHRERVMQTQRNLRHLKMISAQILPPQPQDVPPLPNDPIQIQNLTVEPLDLTGLEQEMNQMFGQTSQQQQALHQQQRHPINSMLANNTFYDSTRHPNIPIIPESNVSNPSFLGNHQSPQEEQNTEWSDDMMTDSDFYNP